MQLDARATAALDTLRDLATRHRLVTFEPSPVFASLPDETARRILIRAANRVGKTNHLGWVVSQRMVNEPGLRARVIGPTNDHIHNVLGKYLSEFLGPYLAPNSYYSEGRGWNGGRSRTIVLANGSVCELRSLRDDPDAHSGRSCHIVAFDEPPTLAHFTENAARLVDTGGQMIVAATMVNRPVEWLRRMVQGDEPDPEDGRTRHGSGWLQIVAKFSRAACPWYTEEQVQGWLDVMQSSPWEWGQRIEAKWDGVTLERLFVGIDESTFSAAPPMGSVRVGIGIDHGEIAGHQAAVLVAYNGTRVHVIDEYTNDRSTAPEEDALAILRMLARHRIDPASVDLAVGDLNTAKGYGGWRINEALEAAFASQTNRKTPPFVIQAPDKTPGSVDWGLRCINYGGRRGDIKVHPRCVNLAATLRHWRGSKHGADGKLSHIADAFRYILTASVGSQATYARLRFD